MIYSKSTQLNYHQIFDVERKNERLIVQYIFGTKLTFMNYFKVIEYNEIKLFLI